MDREKQRLSGAKPRHEELLFGLMHAFHRERNITGKSSITSASMLMLHQLGLPMLPSVETYGFSARDITTAFTQGDLFATALWMSFSGGGPMGSLSARCRRPTAEFLSELG